MQTPVQELYDNWGNRANAKMPDLIANGERVFKVGGYSITVPDDPEQPAKVAHLYNRWGASENPMPNLSFSDGEMRIPVEDFVDLILRRVPAKELAEGLWQDEGVREQFVYCMVERYGGGGVEDADRRKVLDELQVPIHAVAIDRAIERLNNVESELRAKSHRVRWEKEQFGHYTGLYERYKVTLYEMREKGILDDAAISARLKMHTTPEDFGKWIDEKADPVTRESVGASWQESRDYWRERLEKAFPEPATDTEQVQP
jgi:hypothetical protein